MLCDSNIFGAVKRQLREKKTPLRHAPIIRGDVTFNVLHVRLGIHVGNVMMQNVTINWIVIESIVFDVVRVIGFNSHPRIVYDVGLY